MSSPSHAETSALFRHFTAENAPMYRAIMDVFAQAKRQYRLHLRPDEVRAEARWPEGSPSAEAVQQALSQLSEWGNLSAHWPGLSIANFVQRSVGALPWRMGASDYVPQRGKRLTGAPIVASWDPALMPHMAAAGQVLEEAAVVDQLFGDLLSG